MLGLSRYWERGGWIDGLPAANEKARREAGLSVFLSASCEDQYFAMIGLLKW